jgi:hypothetical protein
VVPNLEALLERPARTLAAAGGAAVDWSGLLREAARHGLVGELAARLPPDSQLPPGFRAELRQRLAQTAAASLRLGDVLAELVGVLGRAGVRIAALKGPVLAERVYAAPGFRPSTDLDLLVAERDLDGAARALAALGYEPDRTWIGGYQRRHHHHVTLHRAGGPGVELHFRALVAFGSVLPSEPLLARARPYRTSAGSETLVLSRDDEVLYLCLHAANHRFERLGWTNDLLLFLERHPDVDWEGVVRTARRHRMGPALAVAAARLRRLGAPVPEAVLGGLAPWRLRLVERVRAKAAGADTWPAVQRAALAYEALLCERPALAARFVLHHATWYVRRRVYRARERRRAP